jgi:hypothetical protein
MKAKKKQIREFLTRHELEPTNQLAHDATHEIKTAYEWAKIFLFSRHMKYGFYNRKDFKNMIRVDLDNPNFVVLESVNGIKFYQPIKAQRVSPTKALHVA